MKILLSALGTMPEYRSLLDSISRRQAVAVTGIGQINRSHLIAGLYTHIEKPLVVTVEHKAALPGDVFCAGYL